jgi:hypothetical protein
VDEAEAEGASARAPGLGDSSHVLATARDASRDLDTWVLVRARMEARTRACGGVGGDTGSHVRAWCHV